MCSLLVPPDTRYLGDVAEAAVMQTFVRAGLVVLLPFGRFGPYDLVIEAGPGAFHRVQVKSGRVRNGCVEFNCASSDHGRGRSSYVGRADVLAVHVHETGEQFAVPVRDAPGSRMFLRIARAANNQSVGVRMAADHRLADWIAGLTP